MASFKAIMKRRLKLLGKLFTMDNTGDAVKYHARPGMEHEACMTWRAHGVCPECSMRAISGGRCVQCGWEQC